MANDEFTVEEIEQLKLAVYEAIFGPLFFGHLVAKIPGDPDDPVVQGLKTGMATQGLASIPRDLLERFPVLRKIMWDQRYVRRIRQHFMLEKVKGTGSLPADIINLIPGLQEGMRQFSQDAYGEAAADTLEELGTLVQAVPDAKDHHIHIYTDGACSGNPGPGGAGVVWIYDGGERVLEHDESIGHTTNSYSELFAVQLALEMLDPEDRTKKITLHTDSQYVYNMLAKGFKAKANKEIIGTILDLMEGLDIEILKVPGHDKVWANERADKLAQKAKARVRA